MSKAKSTSHSCYSERLPRRSAAKAGSHLPSRSSTTAGAFRWGAPKVRAGLAVAGEAPALPNFVIRH